MTNFWFFLNVTVALITGFGAIASAVNHDYRSAFYFLLVATYAVFSAVALRPYTDL